VLCSVPFIGGCTSSMKLPREPISIPFSLAEKGFSIAKDFAAVKRTYGYTFSLDLGIEENNEEQLHRLAKLWGGPSSYNRKESLELKPVGIAIPVRLSVSRIDGTEESIVYEKDFFQLASWASSRTELSKLIAVVQLQPGHYRVHLVALDAVPELAATQITLRILIQRK
jgi:hypothetical protein